MEIREIISQKIWDDFLIGQKDYTFLQSWSWGEFNQKMGARAWRFGLYEDEELAGVCQVITVSARRGRFLFVPHGPIITQTPSSSAGRRKRRQILKLLVDRLVRLCHEERYGFLRMSPWMEATEENKELFKNLGFRNAPTMMHVEQTWLVPIEKTGEEILAGMRKTHRNLIYRAQRDGVEVIVSRDTPFIKDLYKLQLEAARRHRFVPFSRKFLETELETFAKYNQALLFLGKHQGEIMAAAIIIFFGKFAFYFQSGSEITSVPVNYLLQWRVIEEAKRRGCEIYNMWGVTAENRANEQGLLMFKSGFGGFRKDYLHAQDLILSAKYWLTFAIEKIPRLWRDRASILKCIFLPMTESPR